MGSTSLDLSRQYTSFSGVDIRVVIEGHVLGTLQAISYAIQREKAPIYVMGRVDPLSFSRGKRGIAGTLITLMLDEHILKSTPFRDLFFLADKDEIYPNVTDLNVPSTADLDTLEPGGLTAGSSLSDNFTVTEAWYVDQIPPFDTVIVAANEYGQSATMRIYGIEILNEGSGFSIDDIVIENQMTYVARTVLPWQKLGYWDMQTPGDGGFNQGTRPGGI